MFTNFEVTRALVADHQQQLLGEARQRRLLLTGRRARRLSAVADGDPPAARVHYLPVAGPRPEPAEERTAS